MEIYWKTGIFDWSLILRFSHAEIEEHLRVKHPSCPDFAVAFFTDEIARRTWRDATLGMAVGIVMQTYLRHHMTDYDTLFLTGLSKEEARRRVQPKVNAIIALWRRKKSAADADLVADGRTQQGG